jgi:hypothetical protein
MLDIHPIIAVTLIIHQAIPVTPWADQYEKTKPPSAGLIVRVKLVSMTVMLCVLPKAVGCGDELYWNLASSYQTVYYNRYPIPRTQRQQRKGSQRNSTTYLLVSTICEGMTNVEQPIRRACATNIISQTKGPSRAAGGDEVDGTIEIYGMRK